LQLAAKEAKEGAVVNCERQSLFCRQSETAAGQQRAHARLPQCAPVAFPAEAEDILRFRDLCSPWPTGKPTENPLLVTKTRAMRRRMDGNGL